MPEIITTEARAIEKVKQRCAFLQAPLIDEQEIKDSLEDNLLVAIWAPETFYKVGDKVAPTEGNRVGRFLKCVRTGTSGTEEPDWSSVADRSSGIENLITVGNWSSGSAVVQDGSAGWVDNGPETDLWDMDQTYYDVWMKKAGKVSGTPNVNRAGNNYEFNSVYKNCVDQANKHGGAFIK